MKIMTYKKEHGIISWDYNDVLLDDSLLNYYVGKMSLCRDLKLMQGNNNIYIFFDLLSNPEVHI